MPENIEHAEECAIETAHGELRDHLTLTETAFNLSGLAIKRLPHVPLVQMPLSRKVAATLLIRLSNDLRSILLLAPRGYALQAASLAANIYEQAYTITYIGGLEARAEDWIHHDDPIHFFRPIYELTREVVTELQLPNPNEQIQRQYRVYRQLCLAKHANPLLQMDHAFAIESGQAIQRNGPDTSEPAIRAASFTLQHATGLTCLTLVSFVNNHLPPEFQRDFLARLDALEARRHQLSEAARERWGDEDPFPGQW